MVSPCYCVVCAVRLQFKIFWQRYIKKEKKITVSPTDYNPSVFNKELQNNYVLCHNHRRICWRTITRRYFTESCKKITGLCHIHRRVYRRKIPTDYAHPEVHACLTRVRLHKYRRLYRRNHRWLYALPEAHACVTHVCLHEYRRIEKFGGIFELFLVRISINFRRNLMPPTTINVRR
jgi:hypothetical protein